LNSHICSRSQKRRRRRKKKKEEKEKETYLLLRNKGVYAELEAEN